MLNMKMVIKHYGSDISSESIERYMVDKAITSMKVEVNPNYVFQKLIIDSLRRFTSDKYSSFNKENGGLISSSTYKLSSIIENNLSGGDVDAAYNFAKLIVDEAGEFILTFKTLEMEFSDANKLVSALEDLRIRFLYVECHGSSEVPVGLYRFIEVFTDEDAMLKQIRSYKKTQRQMNQHKFLSSIFSHNPLT